MFRNLCKTLMKEQSMDAVTYKSSKTLKAKSQYKFRISRWKAYVKQWQTLMNGTMTMK